MPPGGGALLRAAAAGLSRARRGQLAV